MFCSMVHNNKPAATCQIFTSIHTCNVLYFRNQLPVSTLFTYTLDVRNAKTAWSIENSANYHFCVRLVYCLLFMN